MKHCEVIPQLPQDNRTACAETLKAEANVIKDALRFNFMNVLQHANYVICFGKMLTYNTYIFFLIF